jgi:hypothetical protein
VKEAIMTKHIILISILTACATEPAPSRDLAIADSPAITLDHRGFVDDGIRWWSPSSGPRLSGRVGMPHAVGDVPVTSESPAAPLELHALVGDADLGAATFDGNAWSMQLPDGTLDGKDIDVVLELVGEASAVRVQTFGYDPALPRFPRPIE